jgi:archaellum component FlaC
MKDSIEKKISALTKIVTKGFSGINKRLDGVDKRLDGVDKRLGAVDKRLDGVDKRLGAVDKRLDGVDKRLGAVDKRLDGVDKRLDGLDKRFDYMDERIDNLAKIVTNNTNKIDGLTEDLIGHGEAMTEGFKNIENKITDLNDKIEYRTGAINNRLDNMIDDMRILKTSVHRIEKETLPDHLLRIKRLEEKMIV